MAAKRLIGRGPELERVLRDARRSVTERRAVGVLIEGEPGIGKTALLEEACARLAGEGWVVLAGAASELESRQPYAAIIDLLERARDGDRAFAEEGLALLAIGPAYGSAIRAAQESSLADRIVASFTRLARAARLVVAVDDLQWADDQTLLFLHRLLRRSRDQPLFIIGTSRPLPRRRRLSMLASDLDRRGETAIRLAELEPQAVEELASQLLGSEPGDRLLAQLGHAAGNPLYVTELLGALADEGVLRRTGRGVEVETTILPPSLRLAILRRLAFLPSRTISILRLASILGRSFVLGHLVALDRRPAARVADELQPAMAAGLLEGSVGSGDELAFRHELIRDAIYEEMPAAVRRGLHRAAGEALAAIGAPSALVAAHLSRGALRGDRLAIDWLRTAAREAAPRAPATAVDLLRRASALADESYPGRGSLAAELAGSLVWAGRLEEARTVAVDALESARPGDGDADLLFALADALHLEGKVSESITVLETIDVDALDGARRLRLQSDLAIRSALAGRLRAVKRPARAVLELAPTLGDDIALHRAYSALAFERYARGYLGAALDLQRRAIEHARRSGVDALRWQATAELADDLCMLDEFDQAEEMLATECSRAEAAGIVLPLPNLVRGLMYIDWVRGRWATVDERLARYRELVELGGTRLYGGTAVATQVQVAVLRNDLRRAERLLAGARSEPGAEERYGDYLHWVEGMIEEAQGADDRALDAYRAAFAFTRRKGLVIRLTTYAPALVRLAATREPGLAHAATSTIERVASRSPANWVRAEALRCRGLLERDRGALARAVALVRRSARVPQLALTLEDLARVAAAEGSRESAAVAVEALQEALRLYGGMDAERGVARARAALRALGVRRARGGRHAGATTGWSSLTRSEREVVLLVADGLSNAQVAERLFISRRTVESHVSHAYAKLGANTRVELARAALLHASAETGSPGVPAGP